MDFSTVCGYQAKECKTKMICTVGVPMRAKGAMPTMVAPPMHAIIAALKGIIKPSALRRTPRKHLNCGETRIKDQLSNIKWGNLLDTNWKY